MPDVEWNRRRWNDEYQWPQGGDEWSAGWGGPRPQWYGSIFPRIARWLPAQKTLEIAPGFGRWTQFLLLQSQEYYGVDLSPNCVLRCRQRFAAHDRAHFMQNDGRSLGMIADASIDFVFSFDSLVHAEIDTIGVYCEEIGRKLTPNGVAFIHHSNAAKGVDPENPVAEGRGKTVSSTAVKELVEASGGRVLIQEEVNWGGKARIDCMTTFSRASAYGHVGYKLLENNSFMVEMTLIGATQSHYY